MFFSITQPDPFHITISNSFNSWFSSILCSSLNILFGMASLPIRFLTPFLHRPSRRLQNSLRSDIPADQKRGLSPFLLALEGERRCEAASLGNPRGYAPLVAGHLKVSEKGRQGAKRNRSDRWKGECRIPPLRCEEKAKPSVVATAIPNMCF